MRGAGRAQDASALAWAGAVLFAVSPAALATRLMQARSAPARSAG